MSNSEYLNKRAPSKTEVDEVGNPLASELLRFCKSYKPTYITNEYGESEKQGFVLKDENGELLRDCKGTSLADEKYIIQEKISDLIDGNVDLLNSYDHLKITSLIHAIYDGKMLLIEALLQYAKDLDFSHCTMMDKKNAMDAAFFQELDTVFLSLAEKGAKPSGKFEHVNRAYESYIKTKYIKENLR